MTVGELISRLEEYDEESEVRLALQPAHPLDASILGVISTGEFDGEAPSEDDGKMTAEDAVYIAAEEARAYAPSGVYGGISV